jgi:hypothetical protein
MTEILPCELADANIRALRLLEQKSLTIGNFRYLVELGYREGALWRRLDFLRACLEKISRFCLLYPGMK